MTKRKTVGAIALGGLAGLAIFALSGCSGNAGGQAKEQLSSKAGQNAAEPATGPPWFALNDDAYLRWPLPPSALQYGRIDGRHLKPYIGDLAAISAKSRNEGNQWWGRITGARSHVETQQWVAGKFHELGLEQVRQQEFELPPAWYPNSWEAIVPAGGKSIPLATAHPVLRSSGTPPGGIELEPVYVGLGSAAEFQGRNVRGKAVFIYSIPTPSALNHSAAWSGALKRAQSGGAAAVFIVLGIPGNFETQLWGSSGEGQELEPVPTLSLGLSDGTLVRELIEQGQSVKVKLKLNVETRRGLKASAVWGVLPGTTNENILVLAHSDAFFQGEVDNASGVAVMLGLAEYFAKIPVAQRRRTITFLAPIGHHVTRDVSLQWMHGNMQDFWAKTALIINVEHVATTQTYPFGDELRRSTAASAHRFFVGRSKFVADLMVKAFSLFGVALYSAPNFRPSGDLNSLKDLAPGIEVIESNAFYHSNQDDDTVPAAGLEAIARAYAKIIDDVNHFDLKDIVDR